MAAALFTEMCFMKMPRLISPLLRRQPMPRPPTTLMPRLSPLVLISVTLRTTYKAIIKVLKSLELEEISWSVCVYFTSWDGSMTPLSLFPFPVFSIPLLGVKLKDLFLLPLFSVDLFSLHYHYISDVLCSQLAPFLFLGRFSRVLLL